MSAGNDFTGETDEPSTPPHSGAALSPADIEAIDVLIEHEFDLARACAARPDLAARLDAATQLFARLDHYPTEAPDAALTDATLARVDRAERAREGRMRIDTPAPALGAGRWPDLWAVACVALVVMAVGLPLANWMQARAAADACSNNLRALGGGLVRYVGDHDSLPQNASLLPYFRTLDSWSNARNNRHLASLSDGRYVEKACLCCPNDHAGNGYAYQVPTPAANLSWKLGARVPMVADRNPAIELTRAGRTVGLCIINSPDHGGSGQNALFTDASVEFLRNATIMVPEIDGEPRHLENIYLPMSAADRSSRMLEQDLDRPSEWIQVDVFLLD